MVTTATVALIVSITSACITLGGLVWQFTLYRLSGARLKVELLFYYRDEDRAVVQTSGSKRRAWNDPLRDMGDLGFFGIEAARVRVTNVGRSPVSVDEIALDVGPGHGQWWNTGRRWIRPPAFRDADSKELEVREPTPHGPVRLEAGATTSRVYRLWPSLAEHLDARGEAVTVRGTAQMAGRRRAKLSSRRIAWKFEPGEETWYLDHEVTPEMRVYRVLWKHSLDERVGGLPLMMHRQVSARLRAGDGGFEIESMLRAMSSDGTYLSAALDAHEVFHKGDPDPQPAIEGGDGDQ